MSSPRLGINLVVISGQLAVHPEHKVFDSGAELLRLLVTVRMDQPRHRVDVIPVTYWISEDQPLTTELVDARKGDNVWAIGSVQRRYWDATDGRRSRLEVVAETISIVTPEPGPSYAAVPYGSGSYVPRREEEE